MTERLDAVVVGSGPNGLAAAIEIARNGHSVKVLEAADRIGGGMRSSERTLPGFVHDECSAIHPLGILSPFFRELPLADYGLEWLQFPTSVAHPLDDRPAVLLRKSIDETVQRIGTDAAAWRRLVEPFLAHPHDLFADALGPLRIGARRKFQMARFGMLGLRSAQSLARRFATVEARALVAGNAAHSILPLDMRPSAAIALMFAVAAHVENWPCVRGGSAALASALAGVLESHGGTIQTDCPVKTVADLPESRVVLFDLSPGPFLGITESELPAGYVRKLRAFRYGPGVFKLDWALDEPIPWADPAIGDASTVHVGGTFEEIADSERAAWEGRAHDRPFLILCQQSRMDAGRAPAGKSTGYAYCHVPSGCSDDKTELIEAQVERFAPGFRDLILARHATGPGAFENYNPNYVGGSITGGVMDLRQTFARPRLRNPYATPNPRFFLCSASTPPGGGVHGMCGYHAARSALRRIQSQ